MNRSALLAEKRSRLLQAIRQTYNDFFHDYFITDDHVFQLRVSCFLLLSILMAPSHVSWQLTGLASPALS